MACKNEATAAGTWHFGERQRDNPLCQGRKKEKKKGLIYSPALYLTPNVNYFA